MKATIERFTTWVFGHRLWLVIGFSLLTVIMGWYAGHLRVDASFNKGLPLDHPYIRTFTKYQSEFGGANRVIIALMAQSGDIFTPEFFKLLKEATDEVFFLPGVDRAQVQSLFTPNVRYTEVVEDGFSGSSWKSIPPPGRSSTTCAWPRRSRPSARGSNRKAAEASAFISSVLRK
jgi:hypothetical protein